MRGTGLSITPSRRVIVLLAGVIAILVVAGIFTTHAALAAGGSGYGGSSTTPVGSGPEAPWYGPLAARSDQTKPVITLLWLVSIESLIIFAGVCAALFISITRFSHHPGQDEEPKQVYGNRRIEILWTIIPAIILLVGFVATVIVMVGIQDPSSADAASALQVNVTGHQWYWDFDIHDGKYHVHTSNALQLPDNRWVEFNITSDDVIHSFWIPQLVVQVDATPNNMTHLFLNGQEDGIYPGACYEFCGAGHAWMQFQVRVEKPSVFNAWIRHEASPVTHHLSPLAQRGEAIFQTQSCGACHTIQGLSGDYGTVAPVLTHVGSRWGIAGGVLSMSVPNLERWISNPDRWKEGAKMPAFTNLTPHQLHALAEFLWESK